MLISNALLETQSTLKLRKKGGSQLDALKIQESLAAAKLAIATASAVTLSSYRGS